MTAVYWTPEALTRLEEFAAYIAQDAPAAAEDMVVRLLRRSRQLATAPLGGRQVRDIPHHNLRELLERPYRLIYRVTAEHVEVLTVMHYRQVLPRMK